MLKALRLWLIAAAALLVPSHVVVATLVMQSGARSVATEAPADTAIFPLAVHASGRYLVDAQGNPFFVHGDTAWSAVVQFDDELITAYLTDRASKGFKAVVVNFIEHNFSGQTPKYNNVDGNPPFTTMADFAGFNSAYWARVDHLVDTAEALGIAVLANPDYLGFEGTEEGWDTETLAATNQEMFDYGAALGTRYGGRNVIWFMGGDQDPDATLEARQYQVALGILSIDADALISGHGAPGSPAFATWDGQTGFAVNTAYPGDTAEPYAELLTEYARSPVRPVLMYEAIYEQERASPISAAGLRRQSYQSLTSGAAGQVFGNSPIWHGEAPNAPFSYTGTVESNLDSTGSQQQVFVKALIDQFDWWLLEPKTDTSLVTSSLSTGTTRICPALASDGTFAWIWVPSSQTITVNTNALTGVGGNVRIRRYNPTNGSFTTIDASVSKTSADSVATGGEGVIVIDAAAVMFGRQYLEHVANDESYALAA